MVSKEAGKCMLTNSESDSETAPSLGPEGKYTLDPSRQQVRKRNKALQVRFKDICEAQNEQAAGKGGKPVSYKVAYRKYMTVPARRSIPNVTKSTGVQTSPDLKKRYQTFPFERKKGHGHTIKHAAAVESFKGHNNGFVTEAKGAKGGEGAAESSQCRRKTHKTQALLHANECIATVEHHAGGRCADALLVSCNEEAQCAGPCGPGPGPDADLQICSVRAKPRKGPHAGEADSNPSAKRQLLNFEEASTRTLRDTGSKVTGPIAWNSLTQVECLESPSARSKRKKGPQLNGLQTQSQTLPRAGCPAQTRCHARPPRNPGDTPAAAAAAAAKACQQIVPVTQDGDLKAQLQVMENLISSSQETIKVLLGVIQELEKGEAHREG
ncbi:hypothetical protein AAFF_G00332200 [Aldrovandia affinis]|uniref:Protein FAM196A n=1 Tax=Aldrovandia affinis TaxID=143900 RepID=A0AAD7WQ31_9TELE|nr:hypothetical protein AAFF_G00332200 [Aldrovandia affinis]